MASLTWNATENVDYYIVTAETNSGHKVQLSTNDTWTYISELLCGEEYYLSVEAVDPECTSQSSQPLKMKSGWFILFTFYLFLSVTFKHIKEAHQKVR